MSDLRSAERDAFDADGSLPVQRELESPRHACVAEPHEQALHNRRIHWTILAAAGCSILMLAAEFLGIATLMLDRIAQ